MNLLLSRHGNTFDPGETSVWTGSANDLPLVAQGLKQAERLAQALATQHLKPVAIYCSPLQRTRVYAQVVVDRLGLSLTPEVDPRLNEIDYGEWTGLTNAQVRERFGEQALRDWDERCMWPTVGHWGGSETQALADVASFVKDLESRHASQDLVVVVTSNGRLRYFLKLVPSEFDTRVRSGTFKVRTGSICRLTREADGALRVPYWNQDPLALGSAL